MSVALPDGACDAHCHVFGPQTRFPYALGRTYTPDDAPKEMLFALHHRLGIDRAVLVQGACYGTDNRALCDALAGARGSRRGVALVRQDVTTREIADLHGAGVRGVRFNFMPHLGSAPTLAVVTRIVRLIEPYGWHLDLHATMDGLVEIAPFLRVLDIPFVIDHMARIVAGSARARHHLEALLEIIQSPLAWVKLSAADRASQAGAPFDDVAAMMTQLIAEAPARVLWGTDWPHPNIKGHAPREEDLLDLLYRVAPTPALLQAILVDNPDRLYEFDLPAAALAKPAETAP